MLRGKQSLDLWLFKMMDAKTAITTHRKTKLNSINRLVERPCKLVPPQRLYNYILHVLQLVSLAARFGRVSHFRRRRVGNCRRLWGCWSDRWHFGKEGENSLMGGKGVLIILHRQTYFQFDFSLCFSVSLSFSSSVIWERPHPIAGPNLWPLKNKKHNTSQNKHLPMHLKALWC